MRIGVQSLVRLALLLALALAVQAAGMQQLVTGPLINAILLLAAAFTGVGGGVLVALITPGAAFMTGIMRLAPAVPVIMAGNAALVTVFALFRHRLRGDWTDYAAVAAGAVVKYLVMTAGMKLIVAPQLPVPAPAMLALTTMQLYTALLGGVLALAVLRALDRATVGEA
jgi:hypothetical protein